MSRSRCCEKSTDLRSYPLRLAYGLADGLALEIKRSGAEVLPLRPTDAAEKRLGLSE